MKTHILKFSAFIGVLLLLITAFGGSSCNKDKTTHGKIHIIDTAGTFISGATVKLTAPNGQVSYTGTTDGSGFVNFDVRLPAIFDVTATQPSYPGKVGTGVLRLDEPGKTTELTVTIR